jgi:hypothetical protein
VLDAAELAVTLRRTRAGHLQRLREGLPSGTNLLYVPELFGRAEEEVFDALTELPDEVLTEAIGGPANQLLAGAQLAVTLRRTRGVHLARLREELPAGTPLLYVPYLFQRSHGVRATRQVAEHLAEELGF